MLRSTTVCVISSAALCGFLAAAQPKFEAMSLLGRRLESQATDDKGAIAAAQSAVNSDLGNVSLIVKLSQAQASVWQSKEAAETCTKALAEHPDNIDLLTERGHRYVALRRFKDAKTDLEHAVKLGSKNPETFYHLGLAYLFLQDYKSASDAFCDKGFPLAENDDAKVNFTNWCYATSVRAGLKDKANQAIAWVGPTSPTGHSAHYYSLVRFFQKNKTEAEIVPASAGSDIESELQFTTIAFGVANWYMANGDTAKAKAYFERIVKGKVWGTWGFVGSEVELARMKH